MAIVHPMGFRCVPVERVDSGESGSGRVILTTPIYGGIFFADLVEDEMLNNVNDYANVIAVVLLAVIIVGLLPLLLSAVRKPPMVARRNEDEEDAVFNLEQHVHMVESRMQGVDDE